ncbi:MAG TPA: TRAP transporter small permease subunit [Alphaproteobacteria bacterium]|nr:TRAP transporter small permease subunit [Alphaproteobacteria bacterium]
MNRFILTVDRFNAAVGKAFGWYIMILTFGVSYEVFVRYVLKNPTVWAYDISYNMYGALFIMAGAYALSRNAHVRGDVLYRLLPPRVQAGIDLVLFILFFFPGISALVYAGYFYAGESWRYHEVSVYSPSDIPIYPLKTLIPAAGATLFIQGVVEVIRCIICLRQGEWPPRLHDVEEMETAILHEREYAAEHANDPLRRESGS